MATKRLCSVPDCGKPHYGLGFCNKHYKRVYKERPKSDSPLGSGRHASRFFYEVVLNFGGDECLTWPFARSSNGYSNISLNGKNYRVHRLACEHVNGSPPSPDHDAAHTCGQGHNGCVNPRHLVWKTHTENEADKIEHGTTLRGTRHKLSKLTEADVILIRSMKGTTSNTKIAARYNVSRQLIDAIMNGTSWGWLKSP